jgi:hypothetical protein
MKIFQTEAEVLQYGVNQCLKQGYRVEAMTQDSAVLRRQGMTTGQHIAWLIISAVTMGLGLFIYIPLLLITAMVNKGISISIVNGVLVYKTFR